MCTCMFTLICVGVYTVLDVLILFLCVWVFCLHVFLCVAFACLVPLESKLGQVLWLLELDFGSLVKCSYYSYYWTISLAPRMSLPISFLPQPLLYFKIGKILRFLVPGLLVIEFSEFVVGGGCCFYYVAQALNSWKPSSAFLVLRLQLWTIMPGFWQPLVLFC